MHALIRYVRLPSEVTPFERKYLEKTNRIALAFFALHVPALALLAWSNGTNPLLALVLTSTVLAGPLLATIALKERPRTISVVFGVTAMAMGGLLVHFGQGPMQIEMHFYFFALIAMLAMFGNPAVILAAAGTVALHHLLLWFFLPRSVFNYDAPVFVVAVHAAFVVLESIGAVYIARSFFDNVIGLESVIVERTAEVRQSQADMRLVLDNVEQGFVTVDRAGRMASERSASFDSWFGRDVPEDGTLFDLLEARSADHAARARLGWEQVVEGVFPLDVALAMMPNLLEHDGKAYEITYRPIGEGEAPERFLVIVADVTAAKAAERAELERREAMHLLEKMMSDRSAFLDFFEEASLLVARITGDDLDDLPTLKRSIHTLKGNAGIFGLASVASICHRLEDWIANEDSSPPSSELAPLTERWTRLKSDMERLVGDRRRVIEIDEATHAALERAIRRDIPRAALLRMVHDLRLEPVQGRLESFANQAERIARRLDKPVAVTVEAGGLRLDGRHWASFWSAFVHAVRNTVDHGVEPRELRAATGKPETGAIALRAYVRPSDEFVIELADDGPGIDWARIAAKAASRGLPAETPEDLHAALFSDGISTAADVTDISGRGVGMSALADAARHLGGQIEIDSTPGRGTTVRFVFAATRMSPDFEDLSVPNASTLAA